MAESSSIQATITPLPVGADAAAVIIVGGTFDPPHRAHLDLPLAVRSGWCRGAGVDESRTWLVYVPAARSPHKPAGPIASDAQRVAMLTAALVGGARTLIWTDEIDRAPNTGESFSVVTAQRARTTLDARPSGSATVLRWLIGADQAAAFHRWREPRRLISLAEPIVMLRGVKASAADLDAQLAATGVWSSDELAAWSARVVAAPRLDHSATVIRAALAAPTLDRAALARALGHQVLAYITREGLYGCGPRTYSGNMTPT